MDGQAKRDRLQARLTFGGTKRSRPPTRFALCLEKHLATPPNSGLGRLLGSESCKGGAAKVDIHVDIHHFNEQPGV